MPMLLYMQGVFFRCAKRHEINLELCLEIIGATKDEDRGMESGGRGSTDGSL